MRWFERVKVVIGVVVAVLSISVGAAVDAAGQTSVTPPAAEPAPGVTPAPAPVPPAPDPSPHIRFLLARLEEIDARARLDTERLSVAGAQDEQLQAEAVVAGAVQAQIGAERQLSAARIQLGSTAVSAYVRPPGGDFGSVLEGEANVGAQEREFFAASIARHQQQLVDAQAAVEHAADDFDTAQRALAAAQEVVAGHRSRVEVAAQSLADARREVQAATADERLPTTAAAWQLSIQGPSAFTAEELARWYQAQGHGSQASVPIAALARSFVEWGAIEGIRGDMAFAQSIHETGWFANRDTITANNFAGIGHCDACAAGYPFATADIGVLAQIQLLESYAVAEPVYDAPRADPDLEGPAGCCPTWTELGGVWASDPGYGPNILGYYLDMLVWLVAERSGRH